MLRRILVISLIATSAAAQSPAQPRRAAPEADKPASPAPAPVTPAPSTAKDADADADPSTPKGALKRLAAALRDGDAEAIRQVMHAADPAEVRMVAAMAEMARAMAVLQRAAVKAFGEEGAKEVVGDTQATDAQGRARIDSADVRVQGETATVILPEGEDAPVTLRRVDGRWKVPMSELSKDADRSVLDERLAELAEQAKVVQQIAKDIEGGQFNSPAQAYSAWQSRAMQAVTRRVPTKKPEGGSAPRAAPGQRQEQGKAPAQGDASARPAGGE